MDNQRSSCVADINSKSIIEEIIQKLNLQRHPMSGFYKEIYRSDDQIKKESLNSRYDTDSTPSRKTCTSIYSLLPSDEILVFHRVKSDEIYHFYMGSPMRVHQLSEETREYKYVDLGLNYDFQCVIPHGVWFASEVLESESFSLIGVTVAPGFEFCDFEVATKEYLIKKFPSNIDIINRLSNG